MKKKTILLLTGGTIFMLLSLFLLFRFSSVPNERPNGFQRYWQPELFAVSGSMSFTTPFDNIAGCTSSRMYLSVPNPKWIVSVDLELKKIDTIGYGMQLPENDLGARSTIVDSPYVWLFAQNIPALYRGKLYQEQLEGLRLPLIYTRSEVISEKTVVLRSIDTTLEKQLFQKIDLTSGKVVAESALFSNQKGGGFDRDGFMKYDPGTNRLYYLEYYRNQFYCLDTNFNLVYTGKTIDTISTQNIEIKEVKIDGQDRIMPTSPRVQVNRNCFIGNSILWVVSGLKSDNQTYGDFRFNIPIDMYRLKDGKYLGSFNVPRIGVVRPKSLTIAGDKMVVLYEKDIRVFQLDLSKVNALIQGS